MDPIIETLYTTYQQSYKITTDSRQITPGCIFFAFKGETFDGNAFAPKALEQGAALCVISDPQYRVDERCLVVDDVLQTLQDLARHHRRMLHIPFVGITGTNGKTTTKELMNAVLSHRYRTHATQGNHNNHLGVPLTLLEMDPQVQVAIVEMGANHPGEIEFLCSISDPDCGLITNCGKAHLEGFGSFDGVVRTKTELYRYLVAKKGQLFVNYDSEVLMKESEKLEVGVITYGSKFGAQVRGSLVECNPYMKFYFEVGDNVYTVQTNLLGGYNFDNAMAAVCVGIRFGVEPFDIKEALEAYVPNNNRSQYRKTEKNAMILDCYNANPSSMKVALENFAALEMPHKVVMLGGMKELGSDSMQEHVNVVAQVESSRFESVVLVGPEFEGLSKEALWFESSAAAVDYFKQHPLEGVTALLKGSNGSKMWLLADAL